LFKKASGTDKMTAGGNMTLNGNRALAYCRIRYNVGDDFGRTERQRKVISAAINQVKGLSLSEIDKLAKIVMPETETNLSEGELASLLLNSVSYMNYSQQQLQIPATGTWTNATIRGASVLSVNFVKNAKLLQETIYGKSKIDIIDPNEGIYTNTQKTVTSTTSKITAKKTTTTPPSSSNNNSNVTTPEPVTDKPTDTTVTTTKPITTTPTTTPPVTDPPVTDPPVTDPPVSEIPANPNEALAG
ncbi:MAG: LCP family protein, partial [Clostridiales bacterium]|nr:LCP family protein [Clostridiales bacterium]